MQINFDKKNHIVPHIQNYERFDKNGSLFLKTQLSDANY